MAKVKKSVRHGNHSLTLTFIPFSEIKEISSSERIKKFLNIILKNQIVILQGRLKVEEEVRLIEDTMALIGHIKNFKGIELAVIYPETNKSLVGKIKDQIAKSLVGENCLTVIGPASIVKEIKKDPRKIDLMLKD